MGWVLGFRVLGFRLTGKRVLGFRVQGLGFRFEDLVSRAVTISVPSLQALMLPI